LSEEKLEIAKFIGVNFDYIEFINETVNLS
jgi:hypothetical protein